MNWWTLGHECNRRKIKSIKKTDYPQVSSYCDKSHLGLCIPQFLLWKLQTLDNSLVWLKKTVTAKQKWYTSVVSMTNWEDWEGPVEYSWGLGKTDQQSNKWENYLVRSQWHLSRNFDEGLEDSITNKHQSICCYI